ncbi:MAG TPA: hypothetical protein PLX97_13390 [Gemmatales bacterium]|nr:hypothetical protein [Gemmatales bacterium]
MDAPYARNIPNEFQKGDWISIVLVDGTKVNQHRVKQVWPDSLLLTGQGKAIPFKKIAIAEKKRINVGDTALMVVAIIVGGAVIGLTAFRLSM